MSQFKVASAKGRADALVFCQTQAITEGVCAYPEQAAFSAAARLMQEVGAGEQLDVVLGVSRPKDIGPALTTYREAWMAEFTRYLFRSCLPNAPKSDGCAREAASVVTDAPVQPTSLL